MIKKTLFMLCVAAMASACTKYGIIDGDDDGDGTAVTDISAAGGQATAGLYAKTVFKGPKADGYRWILDGKEVSTASTYELTPSRQGVYDLRLETSAATYDCRVYAVRPASETSSKWISEVVEYRPAPGQFINDGSWGTPERAQSIVGPQKQLGEMPGVSLGAFGGYIVFKFDHSVLNKAGYDFVIHGNAFEGSSEPGAVMVAFDRNGNGRPDDDEWYELAGEDYKLESTKKNYTVTYTRPDDLSKAQNVHWTASDGGWGVVDADAVKQFHGQTFWPLFIAGNPSELAFTGTCLRNLMVDKSEEYGFEYWVNEAAGKGYADNFSEEYNDVVNLDEDTRKSNKFDIANAIDRDGNAVALPAVDFIKVYTCVNQSSGWLGEGSTEVCGAISLTAAADGLGEASTEVCGAISLTAAK